MATMADVARLAGVSTSTVSHVLNGTRFVAEKTRTSVHEAIATLGYRQNSVARALAAQQIHTIGLALSALTNPYFGELVHVMERHASSSGYMILLGDTHDDPEMEHRVVDSLLARQVDGKLLAPTSTGAGSAAASILASGTPLVLVDRDGGVDCDVVARRNQEPAAELTDHLIQVGHRRIAVVSGQAGLTTTEERLAGFRSAMALHGLPVDEKLVVSGGSTKEGAAAVHSLLDRPAEDRPTAIVVNNNAMTIGAVQALHEAGLRVPDDIALVAFDDFEWADFFEPRLSAIAQDVESMGRLAIEHLLARIKGERGPGRTIQVSTTFRHRTSCGCPTDGSRGQDIASATV